MLVLALYVRDALQLRPMIIPTIPPLEPAVEPTDDLPRDGLDQEQLSADWTDWWRELLAAESDTHRFRTVSSLGSAATMPSSGALRDVVDPLFETAAGWSHARKIELKEIVTLPDLMHAEQDVVKHAKPWWRKRRQFNLRITELPVTGMHGWRVQKEHVIVTRQLYTSQSDYKRWLEPIVKELI